jgi:sugar phosphate isomerase/epimerase
MTPALTRRDFVAWSAAGIAAAGARAALGAEAKAAPWPFYAFGNGLQSRDLPTPEEKAKLLKDLGYDGIEEYVNPGALPAWLEALDKHGLKLFALYATPSIDGAPPAWGDLIKRLKGRETRLELALGSRAFKPSDPAGDEKGEAFLKALSDLCADTGPVVSVYPHIRSWTERVEDGVRLAKRVNRKNVGTNFNLVHWQWIKPSPPVEEALAAALPHLFLVTLNGLKGPATSNQAIRPLDESDYDLGGFLAAVKKVGYRGPVGLQCFSIKEPPADHLKRSMQTWRKLTAALGGER